MVVQMVGRTQKTLSTTGFGRKRTQVGRKKPSHTKGGRKNGVSPYPPLYVCFVHAVTFPLLFPYLT